MKIFRILSSRFKKPKQESWIQERRQECAKCDKNTLNMEKISFFKYILKFLSDLYSEFTGKSEEDVLGNCSACSSCSVFYKTESKLENCPEKKWKN